MVNAKTGKSKMRITDLFKSEAAVSASVSLDDKDKLLAVGNDDGDIIVSTGPSSLTYHNFIILDC